jgi:hypothetical protein
MTNENLKLLQGIRQLLTKQEASDITIIETQKNNIKNKQNNYNKSSETYTSKILTDERETMLDEVFQLINE